MLSMSGRISKPLLKIYQVKTIVVYTTNFSGKRNFKLRILIALSVSRKKEFTINNGGYRQSWGVILEKDQHFFF